MIQRREVWERAIALIESGSTTRAEVAAKLGVSESAVGYWVTKLRREGKTAQRAELLPVRVTGQIVSSAIEIRTGAVTISVREGTDVEYVAELVRALGSC
jgi:transposase-like protein